MSTPSATGPSENRPTTTSDEVEVNLETEESAQDQSEDKNLKKNRRFTSKLELKRWKNSPHEFIRTMAGPMEEKFVKYWKECSLVLAIAVVLDPRFKMDLVNYYYEQIYGYESGHYIERIRNAFVDMYLDYRGSLSPLMSLMESGGDNNGGNSSSMEDKLSDFDKWYKNTRSSNITAYQKSELDTYLDEPVFPRNENFNILEWWKANAPKLPTLAKMARDVLAVLATTVASESAFSVGGRVITEERASLLSDIVESLLTTNDWIESRGTNENVATSLSSSMSMHG